MFEFHEIGSHFIAQAHDSLIDDVYQLIGHLRLRHDGVVDGGEVVEDEELLDVGDELQKRLTCARLSMQTTNHNVPMRTQVVIHRALLKDQAKT